MRIRSVVSFILSVGFTACAAPGEMPVEEPDGPTGEPSISISPRSGAPGSPVEVTASGFPANTEVLIGFGPPQSEYEEVQRATTSDRGTLTATTTVPGWAETDRDYLWVVADPVDARPRAISGNFRVVPGGGSDAAGITVEGSITDEGVECPALRTADGALYTLAGAPSDVAAGERVRVEGELAEMSFCQQGVTINVREVERL